MQFSSKSSWLYDNSISNCRGGDISESGNVFMSVNKESNLGVTIPSQRREQMETSTRDELTLFSKTIHSLVVHMQMWESGVVA